MSALGIPALSLVVLVGASGSGKSTFAREHFSEYETLSSDVFRGMVSGDEADQSATPAAFDALNYVAGKRLDAGLLTVVDATSVQPQARRALVELARAHDVLPVAIVFDVPEAVCVQRNAERTDREIPQGVVKRHTEQLRRSIRGLRKEGFRKVHILRGVDEVAATTLVREPLLTDRSGDHGPFDVIGDVHGCLSELTSLLEALGYRIEHDDAGRAVDATHPEGRRVIFLGDLIDRGPDAVGVLRLAMGMVGAEHALAVPGNHEAKLVRALRGSKVTVSHGLEVTLAQLTGESAEFRAEVEQFCDGLVSHLILDGGNLVVAHAGLKQQYHGRASARVRAFALYGDTTGETDHFGLPVRYPWAEDYRGTATVLYGHTPVSRVEWINNTACLDTGCVFGGALSAMRYPEREVVQVPAEQRWYEPARPMADDETGARGGHRGGGTGGGAAVSAGFGVGVKSPAFPGDSPIGEQHLERDRGTMQLSDVQGKLLISTSVHGRVGIKAEQSAGALEVISRWAIDPRWLLYLPPTMSPPKASAEPGYLEYPREAFAAYQDSGVSEVICEEKHMGSRAVVLLSRNPRRFEAPEGWRGVVHTRTGRPFFAPEAEAEFLAALDAAAEQASLWDELGADWMLWDGEILPWSLKAGPLIQDLYASVAAAGLAGTDAAAKALTQAANSGVDVGALIERILGQHTNLEQFRDAYRQYVGGPTRFAPFQLLAAGEKSFEDRDHGWHLDMSDRMVEADSGACAPTRRIRVDLTNPDSVAAATKWWVQLTERGGEGMVVKPFANLVRTGKGLVQPGIKVRGREYLRLIYGPDYLDEANLVRLRERDTGRKRSLAAREYALGLEGLRRVVQGEPPWRVHQAVFGVLALESDPIDPRL